MTSSESVSRWILELQHDREEDAAARIWRHYHDRLIEFAARALPTSARRAADEEDVVSQAFLSFFVRLREGRFPQLVDRSDIWRLLRRITRRKAINQVRRQQCRKRGGESAPLASAAALDGLLDDQPTPDARALQRESLEQIYETLEPGLRTIAELRVQGYTIVEIASRVGRSVPTIERRLRLLRRKLRGDQTA